MRLKTVKGLGGLGYLPPMVNNMDRRSKAMIDPHMSQPILCLMKTAPAYKSACKKYNRVCVKVR